MLTSYNVLDTKLHMQSKEREGRCVRYRLNHQHNHPEIQVSELSHTEPETEIIVFLYCN